MATLERRELGNTGLKLSCLGFGASPLGNVFGDTVLGNCLHELNVPREEIVVSTKCGRYIDGFDFSAERVTRSIDESLARLKLDYVDILHCHDIEFGFLDQIVNETIPALQKIRETGKARFIGITVLMTQP
uniref:NADP-dependent oxidoreductase domain-containing protein n=1 Tax=Musa acuminata subsp. malaccensis TaxID=214687 RepID=A0A804K0Y1_MUSAM